MSRASLLTISLAGLGLTAAGTPAAAPLADPEPASLSHMGARAGFLALDQFQEGDGHEALVYAHFGTAAAPRATLRVPAEGCYADEVLDPYLDIMDAIGADASPARDLDFASSTSEGAPQLQLETGPEPSTSYSGWRSGWLSRGETYTLLRAGKPIVRASFAAEPWEIMTDIQQALAAVQPLDLRWKAGNGAYVKISVYGVDAAGLTWLDCYVKDDGAYRIDTQAIVAAAGLPRWTAYQSLSMARTVLESRTDVAVMSSQTINVLRSPR